MRKIAIAVLLLISASIAIISCQKTKTDNGIPPASAKPKVQPISSNISGMSIGELEVLCVSIYDSMYHVSDSISVPTFETVVTRSASILAGVMGIQPNAATSDSIGKDIARFASGKGYLDNNGIIKHPSVCVPLMIANEPNSALRSAFMDIHDNLDQIGRGAAPLVTLIALAMPDLTQDPDANERANAYVSVITNAEVYYMSKLMPNTVAEANAMGAVDGMLWYYETGGHNYYGQNTMLFWSLSFATAYSNAVACSHPNAQ